MTIRAVDLQRLVNQYGEILTLTSKSFPFAYDPETGTTTETTTTTTFVGYMGSYDLGEIDGTYIIRGDRKLILGNTDSNGDPIEPEPGDEVTGEGDKVSIVSVGKIMSSGLVVCFVCQVRE